MSYINSLNKIGIDADEVISKFGGDISLFIGFLKKFPEDKSYLQIKSSMSRKDYPELENAAHTLKGITGMLGLNRLFSLSDEMVQKIRQKNTDNLEELFAKINLEYGRIVCEIDKL